jgi:hypothetical protein
MVWQLDQELFETLKIVKQHESGKTSILKPESNSDEDRKEFDDLVLRLFELRKQGYIEFTDKQIRKDRMRNDYGYTFAICKLNYRAEKVLKFKDYGSYLENHSATYPSMRSLSAYDVDRTYANLNGQLKLLDEKIDVLSKQKILETRAEEKLRLKHLIQEYEMERDSIKQKLEK